jgi:hypothetical protein
MFFNEKTDTFRGVAIYRLVENACNANPTR